MTDPDPSTPTGMAVADLRAKKRDAALAVLTDDERAAVDRAADEARDTALRAALAGRQVVAAPVAVRTPGARTSEGKRSFAQQIAGYVVAAIGLAGTLYGAEKEKMALAVVGNLLVGIGSTMSGVAVNSHSRAMTAQKIAGRP